MIPAIDSVDAIIASIINNHLDGILWTKQLQQVQNLLLAISEADSLVAEIVSKVRMYVMTHKLWEPKLLGALLWG